MELPIEVVDALRLCQTALQAVTDQAETPEQQQQAADNVLELYTSGTDSAEPPDEMALFAYHITQANAIWLRRVSELGGHVTELERRANALDGVLTNQEAQIAANDAILEQQQGILP